MTETAFKIAAMKVLGRPFPILNHKSLFGLMLVSTHQDQIDQDIAIMEMLNEEIVRLETELAAERLMVGTLKQRITRRDTKIATLTADKATVENELRLTRAELAKLKPVKKGTGK